MGSDRRYNPTDGKYWRLPTPHAHAGRLVWRGHQSAAVLRPFVHHADGLIPATDVACVAMTGFVRHCWQDHADGGTDAEPSPHDGRLHRKQEPSWRSIRRHKRGYGYGRLYSLSGEFPASHSWPFRLQRCSQQSAAALRAGLCHAGRLICKSWLITLVFMVCTGVSGTVGETTLTTNTMPSHTHTLQAGNRYDVSPRNQISATDANIVQTLNVINATGGSQAHTHALSVTSGQASSLPPYYALGYIMRIV